MSTTLRVVIAQPTPVDARLLFAEAAALARSLGSDLAALVVEQADLLSCVDLPCSVEVGVVSGSVRPSDPAATRRLLARRAEQLRGLLEQAATGSGLAWSFSVARGDLLREALTAAAVTPVLLAPPRTAAQHVLGAPSRLRGGAVTVLANAESDARAAAAADRAWAAALRLGGGRADAAVALSRAELPRAATPRLLVVPLPSVGGVRDLERLLRAARCPLVIVA